MIGFPDDRPETIAETMALIRQLECRAVGISIFTPYPGLEIYERAKQYGLITEPIEWRYFSHQSPRNHFVRDIPREEFHRIAAACLKEADAFNQRRYRIDRLRYLVANPRLIPGQLGRMFKARTQSARKPARRPAGAATAVVRKPTRPPVPDFAHPPVQSPEAASLTRGIRLTPARADRAPDQGSNK